MGKNNRVKNLPRSRRNNRTMFLIELFNTQLELNNSLIVVFEYLSVITALCVIFSRNAVVSIIYLILLYVNVSIYLFYTGLGVLGLIYILVYVGAIAILFLFILSLINIKISELSIASNKQDVLLIIISLITIGFVLVTANVEGVKTSGDILSYINGLSNVDYSAAEISDSIEVFSVISTGNQATGVDLRTYSELKVIGELLFTQYSVTMLITGIILLLTIIGVIIITK